MPQAFYARGFVRMRLGKVEAAKEDFSKALEFSPENPLMFLIVWKPICVRKIR